MSALAPSLFDDPANRWAPVVTGRKPRAYQSAIREAWDRDRHKAKGHMLVLFTGGGKTFVAGDIAKHEPGRVLFVVNRTSLGQQSITSLERDTGKRWQMEQAENWAHINGDANVVALIQTLMQERRYKRFPQDAFSLVIVDEVHRMTAKRFRAPFEYFQEGGATVLALTATPADKNYQPLITNELHRYPLSRAQADAWSVPFDFQPYEAKSIDLDRLKFKEGDFVGLDEAIAEHAATVVKAAEMLNGERTLVYCPGVKSVQVVTKALNERWPGSTRCYYGDLDTHEGKGTKIGNLRDHKAGVYPYLVSCDALREGYDDEFVKNLLIARPMAKLHDFEQVIGRGSRLWPGVGDIENMEERRAAIAASPKPVCKVIDLACVSLKHKLVDPVDVLGGDYTEEERKAAKKKLKKGGDPLKALEEARKSIAEKKAAAEAAARAKVELQRVEAANVNAQGDPLVTEGQSRKLNEFGITHDPKVLTKDQAQKLISYEFVCRKFGSPKCKDRAPWAKCMCGKCWCGARERDFLQNRVGLRDARGLPVNKGWALTRAFLKNGKKRLTADQITTTLTGATRR